jgi:hypothetical protein
MPESLRVRSVRSAEANAIAQGDAQGDARAATPHKVIPADVKPGACES